MHSHEEILRHLYRSTCTSSCQLTDRK